MNQIHTSSDILNLKPGLWYIQKIKDGMSAGYLVEDKNLLDIAKFRYRWIDIKKKVYEDIPIPLSENLNPIALKEVLECIQQILEDNLFTDKK